MLRPRRCKREGLGASNCRFQVQAHSRSSLCGRLAPSAKAFQPNRQWEQRLVPRLHNLPRTIVNTKDCAGQSIAAEARRARGLATQANSSSGARLRSERQKWNEVGKRRCKATRTFSSTLKCGNTDEI